ncbi:MAG: PHP domain-containing protein [Proteobacteria bacterium]|nr:PHP domain-containing protein [Pseudomonadota bacterium]
MNHSLATDFVDLHIHTTQSDGSFEPSEIMRMAKLEGIDTLSITDHDTFSGLRQVTDLAVDMDINLISGVEISTTYSRGTQHLLGYGFDPKSNLEKKLEEYRVLRFERNLKIITKLQKLNIPITLDEVIEKAGQPESPGRPHIAEFLMGMGIVDSVSEAFALYLRKGAKAYVGRDLPSIKESITMIHDAGGYAFMAHPVTLNLDNSELYTHLKQLKGIGLDGLEVYHSQHNIEQIDLLVKYCELLSFWISGGSDFHGSAKTDVKLGRILKNKKINLSWVSPEILQ